eukprot:TRINITY_DN8253_c0_g2_i5.p1 TRINITY_DN8253_c0_g2~~TRINITY_DN8253_c0_g2_i5.p1  ORF type:complete len:430 (-),score=77.71 TRINITY_DN8253_c0_g2_i5:25-1314(-)
MVVVGLGNKVFQKLGTRPMYNYPFLLSLLSTFVYIPLSFAYIIPMIIWGNQITPEQRSIKQWDFFVMGALDGIAGLMQSFCSTYILSGSLLILLQQSAIPISMLISAICLNAKYQKLQYMGASVVMAGLIVVLLPSMLGDSDQGGSSTLLWGGVLILSCVPMCLSSVYKEKALGAMEIDVVYLNGWIAVWQMVVTVAFVIPAAYASKLTLDDIPDNVWDGLKCYIGDNSISKYHESCPPSSAGDDCSDSCGDSILFVNFYFIFNLGYNILIILILKYGSANILWLAMTVMVPLGNCAFALEFVPGHKPLDAYNFIGLALILGGLLVYRFGNALLKAWQESSLSAQDAQVHGIAAKSFSKSFAESFIDGAPRSRSNSAFSAKRSFHHSFHGACAIEGVQPLQDQEQQSRRRTNSLLNQDERLRDPEWGTS